MVYGGLQQMAAGIDATDAIGQHELGARGYGDHFQASVVGEGIGATSMPPPNQRPLQMAMR